MGKFRLHNPLPSSLASECRKCAQILAAFVNPGQTFGADKIIPPYVLQEAKGLAILTVFKAGFVGSGRFGSGLVVARRDDGWSPPSAIATAGAGFGGQIGFELTDFVFILNDMDAVKTFAQAGSLTLGGNVSVAAGPVGRNAEAAGAASLKGVAGIFAYSTTKGLFAGISLEGSAIIERRDANERLYGERYTASQLLMGSVRTPPEADPLIAILNSYTFSGVMGESVFNDAPGFADHHRRGSDRQDQGTMAVVRRPSTWEDDIYDRTYVTPTASGDREAMKSSSKGQAPGRPKGPKPGQAYGAVSAVALFNFEVDQPGDLGFVKGDVITVTKRTDSDVDWWTGRIGTRHGMFPSNFVRVIEQSRKATPDSAVS